MALRPCIACPRKQSQKKYRSNRALALPVPKKNNSTKYCLACLSEKTPTTQTSRGGFEGGASPMYCLSEKQITRTEALCSCLACPEEKSGNFANVLPDRGFLGKGPCIAIHGPYTWALSSCSHTWALSEKTTTTRTSRSTLEGGASPMYCLSEIDIRVWGLGFRGEG